MCRTKRASLASCPCPLVIGSDGTYKVLKTDKSQDGLLLSYGLATMNR
jgi:hypothetical protein